MSPSAFTSPPRRPVAGLGERLTAATLAAVGLAGTSALLGARLVAIWPEIRATSLRWNAPGSVGIDTVAAAPFLALGAGLAAWWSLSLLLIATSLLAELAGMRSVMLLRCIQAVAPQMLRRLAVAGIGAGLTLTAAGAQAAEEPPDLGWTATQPTQTAQPSQSAQPAQPSLAPDSGPTTPPAGAAPAPAPAATATSTSPSTATPPGAGDPPSPTPGQVVVAEGDSLWRLAAATLPAGATNAQIASAWHAWYAVNAAVIGDDPDLLHPGQILQIPSPTS